MRLRRHLLCCLISLLPLLCRGEPAVVDAVRMPAWLERGEQREPLRAGLTLRDGDLIRTGDGARAYLKLPEGSTVKLGASARFALRHAESAPGLFQGTLDVLAGAFRFTTGALEKLRPRQVSIHVGTATIGIRGTDVWGRSGPDQDLVMLLEGNVEIQPAIGAPLQMAQANSVFTAPKGGAALPLTTASRDEVRQRARQTEIETGDGAMRPGGRWSVLLAAFDDENAALGLYDQAREAGLAARIRPLSDAGAAYRYQVLVSGFPDRAEAAAAAARFGALLQLEATPLR